MRLRPAYVAGIVATGSAYAYDKFVCYSVTERSIRAIGTGFYLTWQYKVQWTPENASEIDRKVVRAIVDTCKKNEGLYVKFGQALASMAFALPKEYHEPLGELHDKAMTFSLDEVKRIINSEVGDVTLTDFEDEPVASASIAQVHRAKLNGKTVAVKIQKPNIAVQAAWDLRLYNMILYVLEFTFDLPLNWTYDYTKSQLLGEVDFRSEAAHSNRAALEFSTSPLRHCVYVPVIYECSERVLISEWIDDYVKITDKEGLKAAGFNSSAVVSDAVSAFAYQTFQVGHVHCDPHPGNLLVRPKPGGKKNEHQIVIIDHGLYADLSEELRLDYANFWVAMTPPQNNEVLQQICDKWGIRDYQLYATVTAFKQGGRSAEDFIAKEVHQISKAEKRALMKERIKTALSDTARFPRPLLFVGRCQNYIRATNWAHGNPIDRVAIMMQYANSALALNTQSPQTVWEQLRIAYVSTLLALVRGYTFIFSSSSSSSSSSLSSSSSHDEDDPSIEIKTN